MQIKTMEGLVGASFNMNLVDVPMRVYKDACRRGDLATMERSMGYVTEFSGRADEYGKKAEEGMKEEAEEAREKEKQQREEALEKKREERAEQEAAVDKEGEETSVSQDTKAVAEASGNGGTGKPVLPENYEPASTGNGHISVLV